MANIDLGTFVFDTAAVEKALETTKKKMFELKQEQTSLTDSKKNLEKAIKAEIEVQKALIKAGDSQSEEYKKAEKNIANLNKKKEELFNKELKTREELSKVNKEYRETTKVLNAFSNAEGEVVDSLTAVNNAYGREIKSIAQARESNKELLAIRNELDLSTAEGVEAMEKLNDKLNENNQFIKESVSGYEQQKINIGDYENSIQNALGPVGEFIELQEAAGGVMPLVGAGLNSAKTAMVGFTKSAIAFLATPVGVVLAVIAGAFLLVSNALNRSEESTNKLSKAFAPISGMFQRVLKALEPLGEFLIDGLVESLEMAEEGFYSMMDTITAALNFLGFDKAAKSVNKFKQEIKETVESSRELAQAEEDLDEARRKGQKTQKEYEIQAEKLRQVRDDESKTIAERIQGNEELGKTLDNQLKAELALAQQALILAKLRKEELGATKEIKDEIAQAEYEILDIKERVNGLQSEQLTNRNSLEREGLSLLKERQDKLIQASEEELALFIAQQGFREKDSREQLEIARKTRDKELEILEEKLKYKKVSEIEYQTELLNIQNEFLERQRDLVIQNAEREREAILTQINARKTDYEAFTQERLDFEIANSNAILEEDKRLAELRLEEGAISEEEYQSQLLQIKEEARVRDEEARLAWEEADKERKLIDLENQRILDEENFANEFDKRAAQLEAQRLQEIEAAEKTGADATLINQKYANAQLKIEEEKQTAKQQMYADALGSIGQLLGQETALGKSAALAQALINTYQGITAGVKLGFPLMIPAVAAATATGFGAVKNIMSTKAERGYVSDGKGTLLKGARHSGGGIPIEAEDGEPILTRKAWKMFPELISDINVAGGGIPLAARGMVAGNSPSSNALVQNKLLDTAAIAQAIREGSMEGTMMGAREGSRLGSQEGSQEGLIGLSENRDIQRQSAF